VETGKETRLRFYGTGEVVACLKNTYIALTNPKIDTAQRNINHYYIPLSI